MLKRLSSKRVRLSMIKNRYPIRLVFAISAVGIYLMSDQNFALEEGDKVRELAVLTTETSKIVKNGCYLTGSASALVGSIWAVAAQNLKVAITAAAVTLVAFKAPAFFSGTLCI